MDQIRKFLLQKDIPDPTIAGLIRKQGVDFEVTNEVIRELTYLKAGEKTLAALRALRKVPEPPQKPSPQPRQSSPPSIPPPERPAASSRPLQDIDRPLRPAAPASAPAPRPKAAGGGVLASAERLAAWRKLPATPFPAEWRLLGVPWRQSEVDGVFFFIPAGRFSLTGEGGEPPREVSVTRGFYLQATEVTQGQWQRVMGKDPARFPGGEDNPVESVSFDEVCAFISRLNRGGEGNFRLPTEAEWELACRAGRNGDAAPALSEEAWFLGNSSGKPHPVAGLAPNPWGVHDMLGNVAEWCLDGPWERETGPLTDPLGDTASTFRMVRGGAWNGSGDACGFSSRLALPRSTRSDSLGFRLVWSPHNPLRKREKAPGGTAGSGTPPPNLPEENPSKPKPPADGVQTGSPRPRPRGAPDLVTRGLVRDLVLHDPGKVPGSVRGRPKAVRGEGFHGLAFDGRRDCILFDEARDLDFREDMTLEVLARVPPDALDGSLRMLVWRGDEEGGHDPYALFFDRGFLVFRRDFPRTVRVTAAFGGSDADRFHLFSAVHRRRDDGMELWVDGRRVGRIHVDREFDYKTKKMRVCIGAMDGNSQFFRGVIARVRFFDRALSPEELRQDADALQQGD